MNDSSRYSTIKESGLRIANRDSEIGRILGLNPDLTHEDLLENKLWDFSEFQKRNLPIILGEVSNKEEFSEQHGLRVLDMPICMPNRGWRIPSDLVKFIPVITQAAQHEKMVNPKFADYYCYITVDQKITEPGKSQRRIGWHTDAFVTNETGVQVDLIPQNKKALGHMIGESVDRTYVATDALPTLFLEGPFDLSHIELSKHEEVELTFMEIAKNKEPFEHPAYTLLRLDPFTVHSARPNNSKVPVQRSFIKIQFSRYQYNREGNTHNELFDYSWSMAPRTPDKRGHRNNILGRQEELNETFQAVEPSVVFDPNIERSSLDWIKPEIVNIQKIEPVKIEPATPNQKVVTESDGNIISINVAPEHAVIVTNSRGQTYCITEERFREYYNPEPNENGLYVPKPILKKVVIVTKNVRLYGPWGGMQYVIAGSALVINDKYDLYAIFPEDLKNSYKILS